MITLAPPPHTGAAYMGWLAGRPCLVCGLYGVHLHHLAMWGLPRRTNNPVRDYVVVPLSPRCHQTGRHAAHSTGQAEWARLHGLDLEAALLAQYRAYAAQAWLALPTGLGARAAAEWLRAREG